MRANPLIIFMVGVVVGASLLWGVAATRGVQVEVREGPAFLSGSQEAIAVDGKGFSIMPEWKHDGVWNDSWPPTCVAEAGESAPKPVRLGFVEVEPKGDAAGTELVAWIDCDESGLD